MRNVIHELRNELIREGEADVNGGGWSDSIINGLRTGHRDLRDSLEIIANAAKRKRTLTAEQRAAKVAILERARAAKMAVAQVS